MKRFIILLATTTLGLSVFAQDVILLKSADEIKCKVVEIGGDELKYRKVEFPDGPLYSIPLRDIFSVTYANGCRETFKDFAQQGSNTPKNAIGQNNDNGYPYPPVSRAYRIGEIFNEGGVKGVVIHTTDDGRHGLIISFVESDETAWGFVKSGERTEVFSTDARSSTDGWQNMKAIEDIVAKTALTWNNFPAFQFCRELGEGWYLPAIEELEKVWNLASGKPLKFSEYTQKSKVVRRFFESIGEYPMFDYSPLESHWYLSSTERTMSKVWVLSHGKDEKFSPVNHGPNYGGSDDNKTYCTLGSVSYRVRAVHKF